jgi:hypothetical protein
MGNYFEIEEFDNFKANVVSSSLPIFRDMQYPWSIQFEVNTRGRLAWKAVEYDDYDFGTTIMEGTIGVGLKDSPYDFQKLELDDEEAFEFVCSLFPGNYEVLQVYPFKNSFFVDRQFYDFDTMKSEGKYIHFIW